MSMTGVAKEEERGQTSHDINQAIRSKLSRSNRVKISGLKGQDNIAVGLGGNSEVNIHGDAGDHLAAFNNGAVIVLEGKCGDLAGETLLKGGLIIIGNTGELVGASMNSGIIVVKGNTGGGVGYLMQGGTIIIDGDVDGSVGEKMFDGTVIITGEIKGGLFAEGPGATIFVGGEISALDRNILKSKPTQKDVSRLSKYFEHYGISAIPSSMTKFRRSG